MNGKNWFLIGFGLLLVLFTVMGASAYQVNQPLDVRVRLQYDNGSSLVDVLSQACIMSVYSEASSSLVVRDGVMTVVSGYHNYTFVPVSTGGYVVSVQCTFNNETVAFHDSVSVDNVPSGSTSSGGGGVLNLDAKIVLAKSSYVVNVGSSDTILDFDASYYVGGVLSNSNYARYSIVKGDQILDSGGFVISRTGVYSFNFDFKNYATGDYKVLLNFDGRSSSVDVKVINVGVNSNMITGFVVKDDGSVNALNVVILFVIVFLIVLVIVFFVRSFSKKSSPKRVEPARYNPNQNFRR